MTSHRNPADSPWSAANVEYITDYICLFKGIESVQPHINAGAKKVVISAPAKDDVETF